jgi:hypothetical protein
MLFNISSGSVFLASSEQELSSSDFLSFSY